MAKINSVARALVCLLLSLFCSRSVSVAADAPPPQPQPVQFTQETLENGLQVIYAPLHTSPVVHVRVLYHVGSRDERPDRQGFAHMFEHMMFRGSAHVKPEEHMKRIGIVGGYSNAFTSFDKTVYINTVPSEHLEMALYLEADRMASFKVSEQIFKTEREVVAKEWGMKQNQPYGNLYDSLLRTAYTTHSYRWTPIGNMDQLRASRVEELQDFFNTYYLPNNAILVIAGDIDVDAARAMVRKYFGWIPRGPDVPRNARPEPRQTEPRQGVDPEFVPLPAVVVGWHIPPYRSDDQYALSLLGSIMGDGDSSRLKRLLVHNPKPLCRDAYSLSVALEDGGLFGVGGIVMLGKSADDVEKVLNDAIVDLRDHGVTEEELAKAKTQSRESEIKSRETCTNIAEILGEEALVGGDANRVNLEPAKIDAVTVANIQAVARKYFTPQSETTLRVQPDPLRINLHRASTQPTDAPVLPATRPAEARHIEFPEGYPPQAPQAKPHGGATFAKGDESTVDGVKVIVLHDSRLPTVHWSLTMRQGSHSDPLGQEGLASLTAQMLGRGAGGLSFAEFSRDLDERAISLNVIDGGDFTRLEGSCTTDQLDPAMLRTRQMLMQPNFSQDEFDLLKELTTNGLLQSQESPTTVAGQELAAALFGSTPLGRHATPASVKSLTLDQVKDCYAQLYRPNDALLVFSGDVTTERGNELAKQLLDGWKSGAADPTPVDYKLPAAPQRRVILINRPDSAQSVIRMGVQSYDIRTDEKFAGSIASQILSAGIDSRLGKYVRAEKGLAYSVTGIFQPGRHGGTFIAATDTDVKLASDAITAMFKVLDNMRADEVTAVELSDAQKRVAGSMVMGMQTIGQQAQYRVEAIMNGYPIDYYDRYADRVAAVTTPEVRDVMSKYVKSDQFVIVVVGPADKLKESLSQFGKVEVFPMPSKRSGASTQPDGELLHSK